MPSAEPYPPLQFLFVAAPKILFIKDIGKLYRFPLATPFTVPHCTSIKQWGLSSNSSSGDSNIEVVYPITFSNIYCVVPNLFSTTASYNNAGGGADNIISSNSKSFIFHHGSDVANCKLYWIAIGT